MTKKIARLFTAFIITAVSLPCLAGHDGPGAGGGGVVFVCQDQNRPRYFDPKTDGEDTVYLADTYGFFSIQDQNYLKKLDAVSTERATNSIVALIAQIDPQLSQQLLTNLQLLHFRALKLDENGQLPHPLPPLGDDDIHHIPDGCSKAQLAVQHLRTGDPTYDATFADIVDFDPLLFASLNPLERGLFHLHEAYVRIYGSNSSDVRNHVSDFGWSQLLQKVTVNLEKNPAVDWCSIPGVNIVLAAPCLIDSNFSREQHARTKLQVDQWYASVCENKNIHVAAEPVERDICHAFVETLIGDHGEPVDLETKTTDLLFERLDWDIFIQHMKELGYHISSWPFGYAPSSKNDDGFYTFYAPLALGDNHTDVRSLIMYMDDKFAKSNP